MLILEFICVIGLVLGYFFVILGFRHRNPEKQYFSLVNPLNPLRGKDNFLPPGFRYHLIGILLIEIGSIASVVYFSYKWLRQ